MANIIQRRRRLGNGDFGSPLDGVHSSDQILSRRVPFGQPRVAPRKDMFGRDEERFGTYRGKGQERATSEDPVNAGITDETSSANIVQPRRTTGSREELARLRGEESAMLGTRINPKTGKPIVDKYGNELTGIDAVTDDNGRLRSGANTGLAGLTGVGQGAGGPRYGWAELAAELSRAGGMFLGGILKPKADEQAKYVDKLGRNRAGQTRAMKSIEDENKIAKGDLENQNLGIKGKNDLIDPIIQAMRESHILPEQAAHVISSVTGVPVGPFDSRKVVREERMGVPYVGREGEEWLHPDSSQNIDPSKIIRSRKIGENTYELPDTAAGSLDVGIQQANATRGAAIAKTNTDIEGDNLISEEEARQVNEATEGKRKNLTGQIGKLKDKATRRRQQSSELETKLGGMNPETQSAQMNTLQARIIQLEKEADDAESDIIAKQGEIDGLPGKRKGVKKPKVETRINSRRGNVSQSEINSVMHQ